MTPGRRIGELLVAAHLVTEEELGAALVTQRETGVRLGDVLVERGILSELQLTQILSNQLSVAWVSLRHVDFTRELLSLVSRELAETHTLIPVHFRISKQKQKILYVAMDDPTNISAMQVVSAQTGMNVRPLIAPPSEIRKAIRAHYGNGAA